MEWLTRCPAAWQVRHASGANVPACCLHAHLSPVDLILGHRQVEKITQVEKISMSPVIAHDRAAHRFTSEVDGATSVLEYRLVDDVMTIEHTGVPMELRGQGIAAA